MSEIMSPVGRIVQGSVQLQQQIDMDTNQKMVNPDGTPTMGTFFSLAFPKILPNGQPNTEFGAYYMSLLQNAAAAWPALFPNGVNPALPNGGCADPRFSLKYQDGDGVDKKGQSVAGKPGFAGHHIVRFFTSFPVRCFHEGKFGAHEEIQNAHDVIKKGFWVRVFSEIKGNGATGTQVPGIAIYPKLVSFVERGEEIVSGPDAAAAFGGATVGWRPPASASPIGVPGVAVPGVVIPTAGVPSVAVPAVGVPGVVVPGVPAMPVVGAVPALPVAPAAPTFVVNPTLAAQGVTIEALTAQGWTHDLMLQHGHIIKVG